MDKKKLMYIGGGILFGGVVIAARLIYINNYTTKVAQQNFTPEVMNELTNGNPQSLDAPVVDATEDEIKKDWEINFKDIPTDTLQQYYEENLYLTQ